jgi:type IV secretion system protein VirD4
MAGGNPLGDLGWLWNISKTSYKVANQLGRNWRASKEREAIRQQYGDEVADAVDAVIRAGKDPGPIIQRAEKARQERLEREQLLLNPPPIHGSAKWARSSDMKGLLKSREAFDTPSSILLGGFTEPDSDELEGFVQWDGDGHLLTVAPTRAGKAVTTVIPNLLRYRGSTVVIDPKGELYAATSAWRAANVGPVYRLAPFDDGSDPTTANFPRHGYNPLRRIKTQADARSLAELMFPRDPRAPEFFTEDAVAFVTALIRFVLDEAPPERRDLYTVRYAAAQPLQEFRKTVERMAKSRLPSVAEAANNVLGKSGDRGLPNLRDTLHSKLALWSDEAIQHNVRQHDFDFETLKDRPATVYLEVPFDLMQPYAPWLRVVLKAALDAMLRNTSVPEIPVLFVLDEYLALGPFPEFRNAIRTHAGAGVRLWFFLQDVSTLEEHYPAAWKPFLNCAVKQFFGINDPYTAELVGRYLGTTTVAYKSTNASGNVSAQGSSGWFDEGGGTGMSMSSSETIQFAGRPLLSPDEVMTMLSGWQGKDWRHGILHLQGPGACKVRLAAHTASQTCMQRIGAWENQG